MSFPVAQYYNWVLYLCALKYIFIVYAMVQLYASAGYA